MKKIEREEILNPKLKDHPLIGNWKTYRELHVEPDWLFHHENWESFFVNMEL